MKYATALMVACMFLIPPGGFAEEGHAPKVKLDKVPGIEGRYQLVGKADGLKGARQIEMLEFFNYSCGHCYDSLKTSQRLHKKFKGKLLHRKSPIYWGQQNPDPAMAFYISDEQGVEKKFTQELDKLLVRHRPEFLDTDRFRRAPPCRDHSLLRQLQFLTKF